VYWCRSPYAYVFLGILCSLGQLQPSFLRPAGPGSVYAQPCSRPVLLLFVCLSALSSSSFVFVVYLCFSDFVNPPPFPDILSFSFSSSFFLIPSSLTNPLFYFILFLDCFIFLRACVSIFFPKVIIFLSNL